MSKKEANDLLNQAQDAIQGFVDYYPHGVNPDLDSAWDFASEVLARIKAAKA